MPDVYIAIGSNVGDRQRHIHAAVAGLSKLPSTRYLAISPIYETAPVGPVLQGMFFNAVAKVETTLTPQALLVGLKAIEKSRGRQEVGQRIHWGPRELDLDILFYGQETLKIDGLNIPHARLRERLFVLQPLVDLTPNLVDPVTGRTVTELLNDLRQNAVPSEMREVE